MKFQVNDNAFQFQKCLNCVTLSLSLFEFIIKKKSFIWNSTLTNFLQDALIGFVPLIPHIGIFVRTYGFEIFENKCLNQHHHNLNPPSSFTRGDGGFTFFLIDGYVGRGLQRVELFWRSGGKRLSYYIEVFLEIPHDVASTGKKSWCVYLSFVDEHVLQNNRLNKIWDDWHCNTFNSVDSYNSCINYSCK